MFYSQIILAKKGPLGKIWIAAHWDKKLNKTQIFQTNINTSVDNILQPTVPLALRVSGHLLLGLVRIYSRKVTYLMSDASEALVKIQMAFRPGTTDLPTGATVAAPGAIEGQGFEEFDEMGMEDVNIDVFSNAFAVDNWMEQAPVNLARRADITLTDPAESMSMISGQERGASFTFDVGDISWGNLSDSGVGMERSRVSRVSDIEAVRDEDNSGMRSGRLSVSMDVMAEAAAGGADAAADKEDGQMEDYDDLGPPTHPGELALDADIGGGRELDDGAALEMGGDGFGGGQGFDEAPEFNADLGDFEQVAADAEMPGAVQLDDDTLNFDGSGFSRRESAGDFLTGGGGAGQVEEEEQEDEGEDAEEARKVRAVPRVRKRKLILNQITMIDMPTMKAQLQDCSDITRKRRRGPRRVATELGSAEERLTAPLMPWLAPALQEMLRACMAPGGLPFPVRMRPPPEGLERKEGATGREGGEEQPEEEEEEIPAPDPIAGENVGDNTQEEIEITRRAEEQRLSMGEGGGAADASLASAFREDGQAGAEADKPGDIEGEDVDNFDLGGPGMEMDDQQLGVGGEGYGDEMEPQDDTAAGNQLDGSLDFGGGVNDINTSRDQDGQELQEEKDEAAATEGGGTGAPPPPIAGALPMHKWHPHTVKVLRLVQKQLKTCRSSAGVTHASITRGSNRRTAAGAFFELLQACFCGGMFSEGICGLKEECIEGGGGGKGDGGKLKTWDFVELSQQESYGDIKVTPGRCLNDEVQTAAV
eukprot:jgi/Undpi1/2914/HiC_scaffold_14.g06291.m1